MPLSTDLLQRPWRNDFVETLPHQAEGAPHLPRDTPGVCSSAASPEPVPEPRILSWSADSAAQLGLQRPQAGSEPALAALLCGNLIAPGSRPYAMRYGGHQFGHWAGQLGDGRVINLGQIEDASGHWQSLQLKGVGRTPYSRGADGRAVLRSSLREYVLSEAMAALDVPTTRALALLGTGMPVERDMLYDGHPRLEPGAVVARVAPSFVRLGNFEIHAAMGETQALRQLVDHCMQEHWPELEGDIVGWYADVCRRTAALIARWMVLGFVHGVMNTDNLSVLGLSIDYGPFGWLEPFEPDWTPNTTDAQGRRYAFGRQPQIGQWNLGCFGAALLPLGCERDALEGALRSYHAVYNTHFRAGMAARLGLASLAEEDLPWLQDWLGLLQLLKADYSLSFRRLADCQSPAALLEMLDSTRYRQEGLSEAETSRALSWFAAWQQRLEAAAEDSAQVRARMQAANPAVVPRNWMLAQAIEAAEAGDGGPLEQLMQALRQPFRDPEEASWMERRPDWAAHKPGCSMLSCSS